MTPHGAQFQKTLTCAHILYFKLPVVMTYNVKKRTVSDSSFIYILLTLISV
jgi:hypothetical protein